MSTPQITPAQDELIINSLMQFSMYVLFVLYLLILFLLIIFGGVNYYKIRDKHRTNPDIIVFLIPFILNFCIAKYFFTEIDPLLTTLIPCLFIFFIGRKLKNIRIIGLTGGIACGKSTLVKQMRTNLSKLHVIDCDQITTNLRKYGNKGYNLILKLLGNQSKQFLDPNSKQIERQKLSKYAFENKIFRKQLTNKMGRYIFWQIIKDIVISIFSNRNLILIDAPILYQSKFLEYICFPVIVIGCSVQQQILRLQNRNNFTKQEALSRINSQMPLSLKQKKADIYVKNEGTEEDLLRNTLSKLNKYLVKK